MMLIGDEPQSYPSYRDIAGLYEVMPGIYQVRGFDLSDISFVRGKTGWIVFDPLVTAEVVRAAWKLFQDHAGEGLPVSLP